MPPSSDPKADQAVRMVRTERGGADLTARYFTLIPPLPLSRACSPPVGPSSSSTWRRFFFHCLCSSACAWLRLEIRCACARRLL